jgi:FAD synthetase
MKKVVAFGTFDGLHEGHLAFLKQARRCGDHLTVVVARDHIVNQLKGRDPKIELSRRCELLRREEDVDEVVGSDLQLGTWGILEKLEPDVIAVGYDQILLKKGLESYLPKVGWDPEIRVIGVHEPKNSRS